MSDNKKWYYLKLKDNFFDSDEVKILESMPNGIIYSNLYLKLCLRSLKTSGELCYKKEIPYSPEMISTLTGINLDNVKGGLNALIKLSMIEKLDTGQMYLADIQTLIGHSSTEAERKKQYRDKIGTLSGNRPPEIELELELKKELELEIELKIEKEKDGDKSPTRPRFIKPVLSEVQEYMLSIDCFNYGLESEKYIDYYTANGWMVGKNKMKDWRAACRNWKGNAGKFKAQKSFNKGLNPDDEGQKAAYERAMKMFEEKEK